MADVIALQALPEETRDLIKRVYGDGPPESVGLVSLLRKAYERGHQDACEAIESPYMSTSERDDCVSKLANSVADL